MDFFYYLLIIHLLIDRTWTERINCEGEDTIYACEVNEKNVSFVQTDAAFLKFVVELTRKGSFYVYMVELPYWTAAFLACASLFLPATEFHVKFVFGLLAVAIDFYLLLFIFTEIGFHSVNTPYIGKNLIDWLIATKEVDD